MGARERVEKSLLQVESSQHFLSRKDILATWNDILKAKFIPCHVEKLLQEQRPVDVETRQEVQSSAHMLHTREDGSSRSPDILYSRTSKEQEKSLDLRQRPNGISKHHTVARCQDIWRDMDATRLKAFQLMSEQDRLKSVRHRRHAKTYTCKDAASPETGEAQVQYLNEEMGLHPTGHAEMACNGFVSPICCGLGKCAQTLAVGKEGKCSMHHLEIGSGRDSQTNMTPQLRSDHPAVPVSNPAEAFRLLTCNGSPQHKVGSSDESSPLHVQDTCRDKRPSRLSKSHASQSRGHLWNQDSFACQRDIAPIHKALQPKMKGQVVVDPSFCGSWYHEQDNRSSTHQKKMETTQDLNCKGVGVKSPVPGVSRLSECCADAVYEVSSMDYCGLPTHLLNILDDLQLEPSTNGSCSPLSSKSQTKPAFLCSKELEMEIPYLQQCAQRATDKDSVRQLQRSCPESLFVEAPGTLNGHLPGSTFVRSHSQHGIQLRQNGTGTPQRDVSHTSLSQISDSKSKLGAQGAGSARRPSRDCCGGEEDRIETVRATATELTRRLQVEANNLKKARATMERFVKSDGKAKEDEIVDACEGENYKGRLRKGPRSQCSKGLMRTICQENSKKHCHKQEMDSERDSCGPGNEGRKRECYRHARDGVERSVERLRARKWKPNFHDFSSSLDCSDESSISLPVSHTASPCTESNRGIEFEEGSVLFHSQKPCCSARCSPCSSKSHQLFRNHTQHSDMDLYLEESYSSNLQNSVSQEHVVKPSSDCSSSSSTSTLSSISPPLLLQGQPEHFAGGENSSLQEHKDKVGKAEPPEWQTRSHWQRSGKHIPRKSKQCSTCMATGCTVGAECVNPACVALDQDSGQSYDAECVHQRGRECLQEDRPLHRSPLSTDGDAGKRLSEVPMEERTASSDTSVGSGVDGVAFLLERIRALQYNLEESYLQEREQQLKRRRHRVEQLLVWRERLDKEEGQILKLEDQALAAWRVECPSSSCRKIHSPDQYTIPQPSGASSTLHDSNGPAGVVDRIVALRSELQHRLHTVEQLCDDQQRRSHERQRVLEKHDTLDFQTEADTAVTKAFLSEVLPLEEGAAPAKTEESALNFPPRYAASEPHFNEQQQNPEQHTVSVTQMSKQGKVYLDPSSTSIERDEAEKEAREILPLLPGNGPLETLLSDKPLGVVDTTKIGSDAYHTVISSLSEIFDVGYSAQDTKNGRNYTNNELCENREVEISGQVLEPFSNCDMVVKNIAVENRLDDTNVNASSFMSNGVSSFVTATDNSELIVTGHQDHETPVNLSNGTSVLPSYDFELNTSTPKEHPGFTRNMQDNSAFTSALSFLPENTGREASLVAFDKTICSEKPLDEASYPCSITPPNQNCSSLLNVDTQTRQQSNEAMLDNELCKDNASKDVLENHSSRSVQPEEKVSNDASEQDNTALKAPLSLPIVGGNHFSQATAIVPSSLPQDCDLRKSGVENASSNGIQPLTSENVDCQIENENYNNSSSHIMQMNKQLKPDQRAEVGIEEDFSVAFGSPSLCIKKDTSNLAFEEHIERLVGCLINEAAKEVSGICNGHAVLHNSSRTVCNLDKKPQMDNVLAEITIPQVMSTDVKKEGVPSALVTEESAEQACTNGEESQDAFANAATCLETSSSKDIPPPLKIYDQKAQYTTLNGTFIAVADQSKPYTPLLDMLTRQKGQLKEQMDRSDALTKAETAEKTEKKDYLACAITNGLVSNFLSEALEQFCELQKSGENKFESVVLPGEVLESEQVLVNCTTIDEEHFIKSPTQEDDMHSPEIEVDPEMCTSPLTSPRPESPGSFQPEQILNGSCNQEEPTSPFGYLSLSHTPFDAGQLLDDQDWFDEDFGLSSKLRARQQQQSIQSMKTQSMPDEMLKETGFGSADLPIYLESKADLESEEEQQFFVPHSAVEVQALVHAALRELHKLEELGESAGGVVAPRSFLGLDCRGHDVESVSRRVYKQGGKADYSNIYARKATAPTSPFQHRKGDGGARNMTVAPWCRAVFDLTKEIYMEVFVEDPNIDNLPWIKPQCGSSIYLKRLECSATNQAVDVLILDEVLTSLGLQGGDADIDCKRADGECDEDINRISGAPNLPRAVKWGKKLRDQVDIILARDLHSEEPEWVTYDIDEVEVKMQTADAIFEALLDDTAVLLNSLPDKCAQPGRLPTSCI